MLTPRNSSLHLFAGLVLLALFAPLAIYPVFLMNILCFALFACAFNLLIGYVGLLSFGHAMFFGFAAYICGHAVKVLSWDPLLGIVAGTVVAAAMGLVAGAIAIRRQGIYFAMVTLALSQMVFFFCLQAKFTGGEDGIQAIPRRPLLGFVDIRNDLVFYFVVLAIFCAGFLIIYRTIHSPFGQVLTRRRYQGAGVPTRFPHGRHLADVGRGGADDAGWRHGHGVRADCRRCHYRRHAKLSLRVRRMGAGDSGCNICGYGIAVPTRRRRRGVGPQPPLAHGRQWPPRRLECARKGQACRIARDRPDRANDAPTVQAASNGNERFSLSIS
jgi:hypothetical protein